MSRLQSRGPVEPPFGCALRVVGEGTTIPEPVNDTRLPRYIAKGRYVVTTATGRAVSPPVARRAAAELMESALATRDEGLAETDTLALGDLIRAIREAERGDPLPPAAVARAA